MSKLSFKTFCIEHYAAHINVSSEKVYELFKNEKLLDLLDSDYEDLHGMGMEYLMNFFDDYLGGKPHCGGMIMSHATIRATIIPEIIKLICQDRKVDEQTALDMFYTSATGASYADDDTGLYGQSALFVYSLFDKEMKEKQ